MMNNRDDWMDCGAFARRIGTEADEWKAVISDGMKLLGLDVAKPAEDEAVYTMAGSIQAYQEKISEMYNTIDALKAENAKLKAEVKALRKNAPRQGAFESDPYLAYKHALNAPNMQGIAPHTWTPDGFQWATNQTSNSYGQQQAISNKAPCGGLTYQSYGSYLAQAAMNAICDSMTRLPTDVEPAKK